VNRRCDRKQKRSERRAIYCAMHECNLYSVSQKCSLFTNCTEPPQYIEACRQNTLMSVVSKTVVNDKSEWLEAFWGDECQEMTRNQVHKHHDSMSKVLVALPRMATRSLMQAVRSRGRFNQLILDLVSDLVKPARTGVRREEYISRLGLNRSLKLSGYFCRAVLTENVCVIELILNA
jgi:hypothetical protein